MSQSQMAEPQPVYLRRPTADFSVDPDEPFLGGGVNPSAYGDTSPPDAPQRRRPSRWTSLRRMVMRPSRRSPSPDMEDGLSVFEVPPSFPEPHPYYPPGQQVSMPQPMLNPTATATTPAPVQAQPIPMVIQQPVPGPSFVVSQPQPLQGLQTAGESEYSLSAHSSASILDNVDGEATLVGHGTAPQHGAPQGTAFASDYAKMEPPVRPPSEYNPLTPIQKFWNALNNMPWISQDGRITVDYTPRRTRRPDIPVQTLQPRPVGLYNDDWSSTATDATITPFPPPQPKSASGRSGTLRRGSANAGTSVPPSRPSQFTGGMYRTGVSADKPRRDTANVTITSSGPLRQPSAKNSQRAGPSTPLRRAPTVTAGPDSAQYPTGYSPYQPGARRDNASTLPEYSYVPP